MVDRISTVDTCRSCGTPLGELRASTDSLCENCSALLAGAPARVGSETTDNILPQSTVPYGEAYADTVVRPEARLDPDRPHYGPVGGVGLWMLSVALTIVVPIAAVLAWYMLDRQRGFPVPTMAEAEAFNEYIQSPRVLAVVVYSTILAHLITIAFCWLVVTKLRRYPFLASLGWHWAGRSPLYWVLYSVGVVAAVFIAGLIFRLFLPHAETPFDKMLSSSSEIRVAVAILATFSAPFAEEIVYRGVLYAGLRKFFGVPATIIGVTILFAGVHVPQYRGAWALLAGLMLLSLILTIVRAKTGSILPCVVIHLVNNGIASVIILATGK